MRITPRTCHSLAYAWIIFNGLRIEDAWKNKKRSGDVALRSFNQEHEGNQISPVLSFNIGYITV